MKLLVTGGTGFLGLAIVRQLCSYGHSVVTFSRGKHPEMESLQVNHIQGDLADFQRLKDAMLGCEGVIHVGAKTGIWGKYQDFFLTNVVGTENVLKACRESGIRNLVFTSSPSVIFDGKGSEGKNESLPYPNKYSAWYPKTKALAEILVMSANDENLKTVCLRPHLIWGPEDCHFLPRLLEKAKKGNLRILGKSPNLVDTIYIENAAKAHIQALDQLIRNPKPVEGKTYFISQDEPIPLEDFMNSLIGVGGYAPVTKRLSPILARISGRILEASYQLFGVQKEPILTLFLAQQLSTPHWYDISAAKRDFGYRPEITFEEGLKRLTAWYTAKNDRETNENILYND
ncbi:NAD-dependent epimerase/dehydratase family protein [Algoriphagus sp. AK58]|uniref:NAD-dependent epimerase/dehydratase family protein n=1 Tax=Algoriphagus sp. AK58 TaxID=1406877 RepID=UPI001650045E|nr:NAD-dependent epimerase/dehydratase family protein [Algoriphagus sp. AK58]MBC6366469.1 3-beta hydroxysteroid dehydrogenase [Algoriphagus sp. AK58]